MNLQQIIYTSLELGFLYGIVSIALVISFKVIKFPDLSVDGVFALGGAITSVIITQFGNSFVGVLLAFIAGMFFGIFTAFLNTYLKVNKILAGILVMISLYSVNLRIMNKSNIPFINNETFLTFFESNEILLILFFFLVVISIIFILDLLIKTDIGLFLRAIGDNYKTIRDNGRNYKLFVFIGMAISSGLVSLAGGLVAIRQGFADINMGVGIIIIGLACLFIGEAIIKRKNIFFVFISAIIGTLIYQSVISIGLNIGLRPSDLKILTALIVVIAISIKARTKAYNEDEII